MYETFEHTADLGLRIRAESLDGLFAEAGRALFSVIVENLDAVRPLQEIQFALQGRQLDDLLHDWLSELLYTLNVRRLLLTRFEVSVDDAGLRATARGEPIDPQRHELGLEIKAVTYHGLKVEQDDSGWLAEVIVDI